MQSTFSLGTIDWTIILIYFGFVLGIGWALKKYMKDSKAFLEAGRSLPAWVTGLAFISANLGALEMIGMAAGGNKVCQCVVQSSGRPPTNRIIDGGSTTAWPGSCQQQRHG